MHELSHECYGFQVECLLHPDTKTIAHRFLGPPLTQRVGQPHHGSPTVELRMVVSDAGDVAPVPPPYFPADWEDADPIVIELVSSRAVISPAAWTVHLELTRADLDNQIVWGRWLLEKAFLILALRSGQHYGLHAGAIVINGQPVIVTADSGVGKSTFIAHGLRRGAHFVGDDALIRHLCDDSGRYWGYPRAAHLSLEMITSWPQLARAASAPVPGRNKLRVEWPPTFEDRFRPSVRPAALLLLTREHTHIRPLDIDQAVERCRSDFAAGKQDARALARVEADVRAQFAKLALLEFGLSSDLDANLDALVAALC